MNQGLDWNASEPERELWEKIEAARGELSRSESAYAVALEDFDTSSAVEHRTRREVLAEMIARGAETMKGLRAGRAQAAEVAERSAGLAAVESRRIRTNALIEARTAHARLAAMQTERVAAENERNGGADYDVEHSEERERLETRLAELRETFALTDWELSAEYQH